MVLSLWFPMDRGNVELIHRTLLVPKLKSGVLKSGEFPGRIESCCRTLLSVPTNCQSFKLF